MSEHEEMRRLIAEMQKLLAESASRMGMTPQSTGLNPPIGAGMAQPQPFGTTFVQPLYPTAAAGSQTGTTATISGTLTWPPDSDTDPPDSD